MAVFAHPDDETSCAGGTMALYAGQGVDVYVVTATSGELGSLGTGKQVISREELGEVRRSELRAALVLYGVHPPFLLGYRDQELQQADRPELVGRLVQVMHDMSPSVIITFGPTGISRHNDHVAIHDAAVQAFHQYRLANGVEPRLFYVAISRELSDAFDMKIEGPELEPTIVIDIRQQKATKVRALRTYSSQEDAQWLAGMLESSPFADNEMFHQAYPSLSSDEMSSGFW